MSRDNTQYKKEWYLKNRERLLAKNKEYRDTHIQEQQIRNKKRYESGKDGYHTVYLLQNSDYVGVTNNINHRLRNHKNNGRDITNVVCLYKTKCREVAHNIEKLFHDAGYQGKHSFNSYK
jgi:predicted GIY-YIG superfamily endonuclease